MKPGRNDPCSCGSGKKYKNCCLGKVASRPPTSTMLAPTSAELDQLIALFNAGRHAELENRTRLLLERYPSSGLAWNLLGGALQMQGKDGLAAMQKATELMPDDAAAHNNLGNIFREQGRFIEAEASYRRTLEIRPGFAETYYNIGINFRAQRKLTEAEANFRHALKLKPDYPDAHINLGNTLKDLGRFAEAETHYRQVIRRALELKPESIDARNNLLFTLNYSADHTPEDCLTEARLYGQVVAKKVSARFSAWHCADRPERLRVGLVSGDLLDHPVGYFLESLLAKLDPARIELIAYPADAKGDHITARIKPYFSAWKPLSGLSDEAAA